MGGRPANERKMRLAVTLLVKDESDIITSVLDYYLSEADILIVTDNGSTDGTGDVLEAYAEADRIRLIREPSPAFKQSEWVTRMARLAYTRFGADWVINSDADEFFVSRHGPLRSALDRVPRRMTSVHVRRHDFVLFEGAENLSVPRRMIYRKRRSTNLGGAPLPGKEIHRGCDDVVVSPGNHRVRSRKGRRVKDTDLIEVFHYPVRSFEQFMRKLNNIGSGLAHDPDWNGKAGARHHRLYERSNTENLERFYSQHYYWDRQRLETDLARQVLVRDELLRSVPESGYPAPPQAAWRSWMRRISGPRP